MLDYALAHEMSFMWFSLFDPKQYVLMQRFTTRYFPFTHVTYNVKKCTVYFIFDCKSIGTFPLFATQMNIIAAINSQ